MLVCDSSTSPLASDIVLDVEVDIVLDIEPDRLRWYANVPGHIRSYTANNKNTADTISNIVIRMPPIDQGCALLNEPPVRFI